MEIKTFERGDLYCAALVANTSNGPVKVAQVCIDMAPIRASLLAFRAQLTEGDAISGDDLGRRVRRLARKKARRQLVRKPAARRAIRATRKRQAAKRRTSMARRPAAPPPAPPEPLEVDAESVTAEPPAEPEPEPAEETETETETEESESDDMGFAGERGGYKYDNPFDGRQDEMGIAPLAAPVAASAATSLFRAAKGGSPAAIKRIKGIKKLAKGGSPGARKALGALRMAKRREGAITMRQVRGAGGRSWYERGIR